MSRIQTQGGSSGAGWGGAAEGEDGAAAGGAGDVDPAAVGVHDAFADGEAEAGVAFGAGTGAAGAVEAIEDMGQVFGGDAFAGVGDDGEDVAVFDGGGNPDGAAGGGGGPGRWSAG